MTNVEILDEIRERIAEYKALLSTTSLPPGATPCGAALAKFRSMLPEATNLVLKSEINWASWRDGYVEVEWSLVHWGKDTKPVSIGAPTLDKLLADVEISLQTPEPGTVEEVEAAMAPAPAF